MPAMRGLLTGLIQRKDSDPRPPITTFTAALLLVVYTLIYVVPFYISSRTRPSATLSRDAPSVIRARITSVTITCIICSLITFLILTRTKDDGKDRDKDGSWSSTFHLMGYWPIGLVETGKAVFLTGILFLGPLFEFFVVDRAWQEWMRLEPVKELFTEWTTWRNIVAGPLTEEILFRSAAIPLMIIARTSLRKTIFLSPFIFGLAHIHHFYEFRLTHRGLPLSAAVFRSVFQLAYTSLFGTYATFVYLRTGSLLAIFAVHAFCNSMGLPKFWGRVQSFDGEVVTPVIYTVVYYLLLVLGAVVWWKNLWGLTKSPNALMAV